MTAHQPRPAVLVDFEIHDPSRPRILGLDEAKADLPCGHAGCGHAPIMLDCPVTSARFSRPSRSMRQLTELRLHHDRDTADCRIGAGSRTWRHRNRRLHTCACAPREATLSSFVGIALELTSGRALRQRSTDGRRKEASAEEEHWPAAEVVGVADICSSNGFHVVCRTLAALIVSYEWAEYFLRCGLPQMATISIDH